jgi:DNA helicase HerA-like ATPase
MAQPLLTAKSKQEIYLLRGMANRHGFITGPTGTGKTVTLQKMAESFSAIGVPVFMADVKGDLSGIGQPVQITPKLKDRLHCWGPKILLSRVHRHVLGRVRRAGPPGARARTAAPVADPRA